MAYAAAGISRFLETFLTQRKSDLHTTSQVLCRGLWSQLPLAFYHTLLIVTIEYTPMRCYLTKMSRHSLSFLLAILYASTCTLVSSQSTNTLDGKACGIEIVNLSSCSHSLMHHTVTALGDLKQALISLRNTVAISTWSGDPCGASTCCFYNLTSSSVARCNWANICCSGYRVTSVDAGCWYGNCSSSNQVQVPPRVQAMSSLQFLNLSANGFTGPLPSPFSSSSFVGLDLSLNSFNGRLPSSYGSLTKLDFLYLNNNALSGGIPSNWADLASLSQLDLSSNCALCGGVPVQRKTYVWIQGTALGYVCGSVNACQSARSALMTTLAIGGGVLAGLFVLGLIGRFVMLRFYRSSAQDDESDWGARGSNQIDYAQRRLQAIIAANSARSQGRPQIFIPLFEVILETDDCSGKSDQMWNPTLIPVGNMKHAILVQAPCQCLCLGHPEVNEEPPAVEFKKIKKKSYKEQAAAGTEVEMSRRDDQQATSSSQSGVPLPDPRRWSPTTGNFSQVSVDIEAPPVPGQVGIESSPSSSNKPKSRDGSRKSTSPSNRIHPDPAQPSV